MHDAELLILGLCVAIPTLTVIARLLDIPYPILLVLGAIPLGYLPGVPHVELEPELVLVISCRRCSTWRPSCRICGRCEPTPGPCR